MKKPKASTEPTESTSTGTVHALPTYSVIPEPTLPLKKEGREAYESWCRDLLNAGLLTTKTREHVESFALSVDALKVAIATGKNMRAAMEMRRTALLKLEKLDSGKTIQGPERNEDGYSHFGFARRARSRRHG